MKLNHAMAIGTGLLISGSAFGQCASSKSACGEKADAVVTLAAYAQPKRDIVQTAVDAGSFTTLVAAVQAAGLVETLKGKGPFTVFAPTDEAFAKLPAGTVENLLKPENLGTLKQILTYHVVPGAVTGEQVVTLPDATTVNGQRVVISAWGDTVKIGKAKVIQADIATSNGVIHVIDTVIMPETKNIVEVADAAGSFTTLLAAAKAAGLAGVLAGDGPFTVFAPTDEAFEALGTDTIQGLLKPENKAKLADILKYHVVPGRVYARGAVAAGSARTLQGDALRVSINEGRVVVNGAGIVMSDVQATNGVVHVIDRVLLPN